MEFILCHYKVFLVWSYFSNHSNVTFLFSFPQKINNKQAQYK